MFLLLRGEKVTCYVMLPYDPGIVLGCDCQLAVFADAMRTW